MRLTPHEVNKRAKCFVLEALKKRGEPATLDGKKVAGRNSPKHNGWALTSKDEIPTPGLCYYFVDMVTDPLRPEIYKLRSEDVAQWLYKDHRDWLSRPGRHGQKHQDNPV